MNSQPELTTIATAQTIVFEPTSGGGGSFWNGDSLLATLLVAFFLFVAYDLADVSRQERIPA